MIRYANPMNDDAPDFLEEIVEVPVDGKLDLHTFLPKELAPLLDDYLQACLERGILDVRIIHGKGKGILMKRVHAILSRHPLVDSFSLASHDHNNWGATLVALKSEVIPYTNALPDRERPM
jgi:DNA-nicking Smr family endonuclease